MIEKSTLYSNSVNNYWNAFYVDTKQCFRLKNYWNMLPLALAEDNKWPSLFIVLDIFILRFFFCFFFCFYLHSSFVLIFHHVWGIYHKFFFSPFRGCLFLLFIFLVLFLSMNSVFKFKYGRCLGIMMLKVRNSLGFLLILYVQ